MRFSLSLATMLLASASASTTSALTNTTSHPHPNLVAGTWNMTSSSLITNGTSTPLWGPHGHGLLIFTSSLYFTAQFNLADLPFLPSNSDRTTGTPAENEALVAGTLVLSGTYTVDEKGEFTGEHVLGSTFSNWIGLVRGTDELTETVEPGEMVMVEELVVAQGVVARVVWERVD